jgi:gamma-glutamyltranspeptidase
LAQVGARAILAGQTLEEAQNAPRWAITEFGPFSDARFQVESGVPTTTLSELRDRGHIIEEVAGRKPGWGPVSIIEVDGDHRSTHPDPRVDTTSAVIF